MPRTLAPGGSARLGGTISAAVEIEKRRFPFGPIALSAVVYAAAYLVWERSDWGSPTVRDLLGNIAFMPLNLAVLGLYFLAARSPVLDPGVRRALRFLALGSMMVFTGNAISTWYLMGLGGKPAGLLGRSVLPGRLALHPRGPALVPPRPPYPDGAVEVRARRRDGTGGRRGRDLVLVGAPAAEGDSSWPDVPGLRLPAGGPAPAAGNHHRAAPPAGGRQPTGLRHAGDWRDGQHRRRPRLYLHQPGRPAVAPQAGSTRPT